MQFTKHVPLGNGNKEAFHANTQFAQTACWRGKRPNGTCKPSYQYAKVSLGFLCESKALYHVLPLDFVTISNLQSKLEGQANESSVHKLLDKMDCDGFIED